MFKNCKPHPLSFLTLLHPFLKNNSLHFFFFCKIYLFQREYGNGGKGRGRGREKQTPEPSSVWWRAQSQDLEIMTPPRLILRV